MQQNVPGETNQLIMSQKSFERRRAQYHTAGAPSTSDVPYGTTRSYMRKPIYVVSSRQKIESFQQGKLEAGRDDTAQPSRTVSARKDA
jgi:hypothetical protein